MNGHFRAPGDFGEPESSLQLLDLPSMAPRPCRILASMPKALLPAWSHSRSPPTPGAGPRGPTSPGSPPNSGGPAAKLMVRALLSPPPSPVCAGSRARQPVGITFQPGHAPLAEAPPWPVSVRDSSHPTV
jgi:hypothetical protein